MARVTRQIIRHLVDLRLTLTQFGLQTESPGGEAGAHVNVVAALFGLGMFGDDSGQFRSADMGHIELNQTAVVPFE